MNRRTFLQRLSLGAAAAALPGCTSGLWKGATRAGHPNFVIIFADDLGYADVGCYGAKGFETPHIDRLAAEGIRFTDFYVSQAVCSASRAALLTGCYSNRVSVLGALGPNARKGLHPEEETIAEVLGRRGYVSGVFGKWHLGRQREFLPLQQGFDEYFGLPYSNDMWPVGYDGVPLTEENPGPRPHKAKYPQLALIDGNEKADEIRTLEDQATLTTRYTERAVSFIDRNRDRPFFLYLPHSMPHVPLGVSDRFRGKSEQGRYGDVVMEIDWSVGEVMRALERNGLTENTLVIFTSDNGPWLNYGNHAGCALPLREGKGTSWDGGARVPCVMRWPARIPAGAICGGLAATIDILPTFAAVTGAPLPERTIDGVSILPLLAGESGAVPRDHLFFYYGGQLQGVRQGRWKLHFPHSYRSYQGVEPGQDGFPGPYASGETGLELFDLEMDIGETTNVAAEHPDVVARLEALAEIARREIGDKLTDSKGAGVRPAGKVGGE
jgi:arylsulfatase